MKSNPPENRSTSRFPWWGSVLLAVFCYCTLRYLIPGLQPTSPSMAKLIQAAPAFAPVVTIPLQLLAAKQLYDTDQPEQPEDKKDDQDNAQKG